VFPRTSSDSEVVAYQEISGQFSPPSAHVPVDFREDIPQPTVIQPVRPGDTEVWCSGLLPGAHVRIFNRQTIGMTLVSVQIGGGTALDTSGPIPVWGTVPQFARIVASQVLCREGRQSDPEVVVSGGLPCDGPPTYDPGKWNDGGFHQNNNRCYNYGCDLMLDDTAQPGGGVTAAELNCTDVTAKIISDGLLPCTTGLCHPCHHRVALVIDPGHDFHFYRQDINGMWSHKPGIAQATNVDAKGNPIPNPETADRHNGSNLLYTDFCGYFCVYKPNVKI
jgi:hypothetical protein